MVGVFVLLNAVFLVSGSALQAKGIDPAVVLGGNLVLFLVSLISLLVTSRSLTNSNPHVFVRAVYSGFIIKFFVVVFAAFIYFKLATLVNKPALFVCLILYIIYTAIEINTLMRMMKETRHA